MDDKLLTLINEIREDKGEDPVTVIDDDVSLRRDLGFDSMDLAVLTARLDELYSIDIFEKGLVDSIREVRQRLG